MSKNLVLVLNCGSSSIKFAILDPEREESLFHGLVQRLESNHPDLKYTYDAQTKMRDLTSHNHKSAIKLIIQIIKEETNLVERIAAVGHRVVHGGEKFAQSAIITEEVLGAIKDCVVLGPLHNPANIAGIEGAMEAFPGVTQVAVFDTAFHQTLPEYAYLYPIPYHLYTEHAVRRYGFHGTSHRFVAAKTIQLLNLDPENNALIVAHLGNGCSVTAVLNGQSVDTSMGLTPLEGLVMGTRSGDVDPSLPGYLVEKLNCSLEEAIKILNRESGLLGLSGVDSDMRTIEAGYLKGELRATLALEVFCYRLAKYIASYLVPLKRLDALTFTGGIGEHSPLVRGKILELLAYLQFQVDLAKNEQVKEGVITAPGSKPAALVVPTNEELMIAKDTLFLVH